MPESSTKTESKKTKGSDEPKATLPVGHPKAGYTSPDLSFHEGTGTIPDEEREWHEARNKAQQEDAEAIAEEEDKVAKEEQEAQRKELEEREKAEQKKMSEPAGGTSSKSS